MAPARRSESGAAMTIEPMTTLQAVLLILAGAVNFGAIVIFLRIVWEEARSSLSMRTRMTILLEEVELRRRRLDQILAREGGRTIGKDCE
jgi:hypothetical protein